MHVRSEMLMPRVQGREQKLAVDERIKDGELPWRMIPCAPDNPVLQ